MSTALSVDTSWRFFRTVIGVHTWWEAVGMFAVIEAMLIACGYAMRANVRQVDEDGKPGSPGVVRWVAWALCGASAYTAILLSGPLVGLARVILGPVLGLVALHLALGIEIRVHRKAATGTWARIRREMRERFLSRFGLADDSRDARARTQDRAEARAARLATSGWFFRGTRLARAVRACGATSDAARRTRLMEQVATLQHLGSLSKTVFPSPWTTVPDDTDEGSAATVPTTPRKIPAKGAAAPPPGARRNPGNGAGNPPGGTPDGPLRVILRNPSKVSREPDGTVPVKRAMKVLGVGRDRALRLLDTEGLLRRDQQQNPTNGTPVPDLVGAVS